MKTVVEKGLASHSSNKKKSPRTSVDNNLTPNGNNNNINNTNNNASANTNTLMTSSTKKQSRPKWKEH